ncbi:DUF1523 family protein [Acidimangrovimonas sediminis]|uniref:DUF1523 family protein n=1 Tax=Acidimangrovimonas sediminis TaxID=2056283 RepID=UPI001E3B4F01|nr:DUF1523 family protein [Acidimangrovimonas sediminis]
MASKLKWGFIAFVAVVIGLFLDYTLPQHDVVRITNSYNRVTTLGSLNRFFYASPDAGTKEAKDSRDIRFIEAVYPSGKVIVYRNEDTGWIWPPYFKYDSSNLQAKASALKSSSDSPKWVVVTKYGWRIPFLSIYPNAIGVKQVAGPDVSIFPWLNIVILAVLALIVFFLWRMWVRFRERTLDPLIAGGQERLDRTEARAETAKVDARNWWRRNFGRKK